MNPKDSLDPVEVRRSRKRLRTVTAYRDGDRIVVAIPARFTRAQEREWVRRMVARLADQERRRRPSDEELTARAVELSTRYLGGRATPTSVNWSANQGRRWGSCTPADGTIRISTRVRGMPRWVIDYVLLHELAHLQHIGHGPDFWAALETFPRTERARGYLEGVTFGEERVSRADPDATTDATLELEPAAQRSAAADEDDDVRVDAELIDADVSERGGSEQNLTETGGADQSASAIGGSEQNLVETGGSELSASAIGGSELNLAATGVSDQDLLDTNLPDPDLTVPDADLSELDVDVELVLGAPDPGADDPLMLPNEPARL